MGPASVTMGGSRPRSSSSAGPSAPNTARRIALRVMRDHRLQCFELAALRPGRDLAHHLVFDDVLVASHPLAVKRREHQFAAREEFVAGKAERRPGAECLAEDPAPCRAFDQIAARAEHILNQDWVADHHRLAEERQIDGDTALPYRRPRAANIPCVAAKNAMPWTVFGIRGPGGSRTGSVVAVAMSFLPCRYS